MKLFLKFLRSWPSLICTLPILGLAFAAMTLPTTQAAAQAMLSAEHGLSVPTKGTIRALLVFAEVDFTACRPGPNDNNPAWPESQLPPDVDDYFNHALTGAPFAFVTDYFHQMSFGKYVVLGDYIPTIVTVPCNPLPSQPPGVAEIVSALGGAGAVVETAHVNPATGAKYTLDDFDLWTDNPSGQAKDPVPDQEVDMLLVVWRNYDPLRGTECTNSFCFTGFIGPDSSALGNMIGFSNAGSFVAYGSGAAGKGVLIHEYMHAMFGGNNWHIGGGTGVHSLLIPQGSYGMTAHSPAASNVASGWDRHQMGYAPDPADGPGLIELDIASHPDGGVFVLRDFIRYGDAIRIKLPHLNWTQLDDVKNQYLWLENRRQLTPPGRHRFDINYIPSLACHDSWTEGLYAYVQIGKDTKSADADNDGDIDAVDLYAPLPNYPNGLGSFIYPLTAEGNFDFFYRLDLADRKPGPCQFNNVSLPIDESLSLPNPFTGYSDVYAYIDSDDLPFSVTPDPTLPATHIPVGDGVLFQNDVLNRGMAIGENISVVLSEFENGQVELRLPQFGDAEDAFSFANGNTRLAIDTNPAPVPVYTRESGFSYVTPNVFNLEHFDNRKIWLNGLAIEILQEDVDGSGAIALEVRWDNYDVDDDVRWTGDIVLQNDARDPRVRQSQIRLGEARNLFLDRGLSPTRYEADSAAETVAFPQDGLPVYPTGLVPETGRLFTDPTTLTLVSGTQLYVSSRGTVWVQNGSQLEAEPGSEIVLEHGANLLVANSGGQFKIEGLIRSIDDPSGLRRFTSLIGDEDSFVALDAIDVPRRSDNVLALLSAIAMDPGQGTGVDLDAGGSNRPVGLTHFFVLPHEARITSAIVNMRLRAQDSLAKNDVILFDESSIVGPPFIALRDILGREPVAGEVFDIEFNLGKVPVRSHPFGPPGASLPATGASQRSVLSNVLDGQFDMVVTDDAVLDFSKLTLTYALPTSPVGDLTADNVVDRADLDVLVAVLNTDAYADDPRDLNADGRIDVLDLRQLVLSCDRPLCATKLINDATRRAIGLLPDSPRP